MSRYLGNSPFSTSTRMTIPAWLRVEDKDSPPHTASIQLLLYDAYGTYMRIPVRHCIGLRVLNKIEE